MIEAGTLLQNRYRIDRKIGQGGMGAVYIATDERFGSVVAIKETFFADQQFGKAFEREARLLNNLKHPALPRVSDHFVDENGQFLVMEYIDGDDLSEMMERGNKPFPLTDVKNWADQLLDALDYLHSQETPVIHRDIKPQNLKLTSRGKIILLDFGLAKGNPTDANHQTAAKSVFGYSRNYASLEQIQGTGTEPRSDLYALGATLYHLATGVPPEDALTRAMDVLSNKPDSLKSAREVEPSITEQFSNVLQLAMDLNAGNRPVSASEMRQMLDGKIDLSVAKTIANEKNVTEGLQSKNDRKTVNENAKTQIISNESDPQTSVETRLESNSPFVVNVPNQTQPRGFVSKPENKRGGLIAIAAAAVLLAVGGLGIAAMFIKSPQASSSNKVETTNAAPQSQSDEKVETKAAVDVSNSNSLPISSIANVNLDKRTDSPVAPVPAQPKVETSIQTPDAAKSVSPTTKKSTEAKRNDANDLIIDTEDAKIYKNGTVETEDMIISPDGRIKEKPPLAKPPAERIPTKEEFDQMTPQQKRRMKKALDNLPASEKQKVADEIERRRRERMQNPVVSPNRPIPPKP
jgi:serine/threonine protein kinase